MKQFLKFLFEIGPLIVFFVANSKWGIMPATGDAIPLFEVGDAGPHLRDIADALAETLER